jgi:hypothetical protein
MRERWVGSLLPVARSAPVTTYGFKDFRPHATAWPWTAVWWLLTRQLDRWNGYLVNVDDAWRILESHDSEAAAWWRENTPHLAGTRFVFPLECCEPV